MRALKSFTGKRLTRQKLMLLRSGEDVDRDFEISSFSDESLWVTGQALCARTTVHIEKKKTQQPRPADDRIISSSASTMISSVL